MNWKYSCTDSSDRLISTTRTPEVVYGTGGSAHCSTGRESRCFPGLGIGEGSASCPFKQQTRKVKTGEQVLAALYIDKSGRLCATMNVYEHLRTDSPYKRR